MSESLGVAYGTVVINVSGALASLAALRAASRSSVEALNTIGRASIRAGAGLMGFGAIIVGAFALAVIKTAQLEKRMSFIKGITNLSAVEVGKLREKVLELGASSAYTANQVADGFVELSKAGATSEQIMGGMGKAMITLGQSSDISLDKAATTLISIASTFDLLPKDAAHIADVIQGTANASIISVEDMTISMKYAGGVAANLGVSLEDTATAIALLGQAGIRGSQAGTSLRRIFLQLTPRTLKAEKAMKALGIITKDGSNKFYDATGKAKKMSEITQILHDSTKGLTAEMRQKAFATIFGDRAINSAIALSKNGAIAFDKMKTVIGNTKAEDVAAERLNNLAGAWRIFRGTLDVAIIRLGTPAQEPLKKLVQNLTKVVRAFANLNPKIQQFIVKVLLTVAAISLATGAFLVFFGTVLRVIAIFKELQIMWIWLRATFLALTGATSVLGGVLGFLTSAVFLTVLAIVAVIAAIIGIFVAAYKNSKPLRDALESIGNTIKTAMIPVIKKAKELWAGLVKGFKTFTGGIGNQVAKGITVVADSLVALIDGFNGVKTKQDGIVGFFNTMGQGLKKAWVVISDAFDKIKNAVTSFVDGFQGNLVYNNGVLDFFNVLGAKVREFYDKVVVKAKAAFQGIKDAVTSFVDGFTGKATGKDGPLGFFERLGVAVRQFNDGVVAKIKAAFTGLSDATKAFIDGFSGNATGKDGPLGFFERLGAAVKFFNDQVVVKLQEAWTAIKGGIQDFTDFFEGKTTPKYGPQNFFQKLGDKVRWFKDTVVPLVQQAFTDFKVALGDFIDAFSSGKTEGKDSPRNFFQRLGDAVRYFKDTVVENAKAAFQGFKDAWFAFQGGFNGESTGKDGPLGVFEKLGVGVKWLKENVWPILVGVLSGIKDAWDSFKQGFAGGGEWAESGLGKGFQVFGAILGKLKPLFTEIWNKITQELWPALQDLGGVITRELGPAFGDLWKTIKEELWPALQNLWKTIREDLWPALQELFEILKPGLKVLGYLALIIVGVVIAALVLFIDVLVTVITFIVKLFTTIVETVINIISPILNAVVSIITAVVDIISGIVKVFSGAFTNDWGLVWEGVLEILKGAWDAIAAVFVAAWNVIYAIVEGIVNGIIDFFTSLADTLVGHSIIPDMVNDIVAWFAGLPGKIWTWISQLVSSTIGQFIELASTVLDNVSRFVAEVVDYFIGLAGDVGTKLLELVATVAGLGVDFYNAAVGLGTQIVNGIMGAVDSLPGLVWGALTGTVSTVTDFLGNAWQAASDFGTSLWEGFKNGMGIHSPSYIEQSLFQVTDTTHSQLGIATADVGSFNALGAGLKYPIPAPPAGWNGGTAAHPSLYDPKVIVPDSRPFPAQVNTPSRPAAGSNPYAPGTKPGSYVSPDVAELKGLRADMKLLLNLTLSSATGSAIFQKSLMGQMTSLNTVSGRMAIDDGAQTILLGESGFALREIQGLMEVAFGGPNPNGGGVTPPPPKTEQPVNFYIETVQDGDSLLRRARATNRMLSLAEGGDSNQVVGI